MQSNRKTQPLERGLEAKRNRVPRQAERTSLQFLRDQFAGYENISAIYFDLDTGASSKWLQAYKLPHSAQQGSLHVMVTQNLWTNSGREVVSSPLPTDMGPHINGLPD